jgi:UDP-glucuronate 4-epimerase
MDALVTGGAGFIGSHLVDRLLSEGWRVTVIDNFDPFYDPALKRNNIATHIGHANYTLLDLDIRDLDALRSALAGRRFDVLVHLAAKAGVRPSIARPLEYQDVNVRGTHNLLELAREMDISQFVFASSSSVYGVNPNVPWREDDAVLRPISPYASTKVSGELLGHVYSHLHGIRFIALRLFTVYGPRQRPDLAIHKFARMMLQGEAIPVYGDGSTYRDYTYVEDIVEGLYRAMHYTGALYEVINLGNNQPVSLLEMIQSLERTLGVVAVLQFLPPQAGDVPRTCADTAKAESLLGFKPTTPLQEGLERFVIWLSQQDALSVQAIGRVVES